MALLAQFRVYSSIYTKKLKSSWLSSKFAGNLSSTQAAGQTYQLAFLRFSSSESGGSGEDEGTSSQAR